MDPSCFPWHPASSSPASCKPLVDPFPHHPDVFPALPSRWDSCRKSPARTWTLSAPVPCFDSVMESDIDKLFTLPDEHWSPPVLSMDAASKGTGLFSVHDANLAASHCLAGFSTDPGFAERAAKFSCFGNPCAQPELAQHPYVLQDGCNAGERSTSCASDKLKVARLSSDHRTPRCSAPNSPVIAADSGDSRKASEIFTLKSVQEDEPKLPNYQDRRSGRISPFKKNDSDEVDGCSGLEVSSSCERAGCETASQSLMENRGKKRKPGCKERSKDAFGIANSGEVKDLAVDEGKGQNHKSGEDQPPKMEQSISGNSDDSTPKSLKGSCIKTSEAAKPDYIHVRARRGQATDSHSLAERVRREKISERMKYLQDLVPGCSKVTGKAVMLDEIINYVQSLQRQVEFLSMKLAAMNPRLEFNLDSLFGKETTHSRVVAPSLHFAQENNNSYPSLHQQQQQAPVQAGASCPPVDFHSLGTDASRTISNPQASINTYGDSVLQISQAWYEELHSVSQMGTSQGTRTPLTSPGLQGGLYPGQMKVEL